MPGGHPSPVYAAVGALARAGGVPAEKKGERPGSTATKNLPDEAVASPHPAGYLLLRSHCLLSSHSSFFGRYHPFHGISLLGNGNWGNIASAHDPSGWEQTTWYIGLTLILTVGLRYTNHVDEFHITTSPQIDLPGDKLPSTLVELLYFYSNKILRSIVFFIRITFRRIYLNRKRSYMTGYLLFALLMLKSRSFFFVFLYGGNIPSVVSVCFALSEPRQPVRTVRVPYQPSVFAPFCLKSAG